MNPTTPYLIFDFANQDGIPEPISFSNPLRIVSATSVDAVYPALCDIQAAVNEGYYAAGFISYEAAPAFDPAFTVMPGHKMPLLWFGLFARADTSLERDRPHAYQLSPWVSDTSRDDYLARIQDIKAAIARGDTYQVNYTMRLRAQFSGDDLAYYHFLRSAQQANYSAYLNTGRLRILSASPELFFRLDDRTITARPMKGTMQRGRWLEEDQLCAQRLLESEKDRAENLMIVDLLRHDISKIAGIQNVQVPRLFAIERYRTLLQMTSTVTATAPTNTTFVDVLKALFPCGSITGAPKISTMHLISKLEQHPRELYCGAIGFIKPNGDAVFNVAIRTVHIDTETGIAEYGVGGGVTWDSTAAGEYAEAFTKTALLHTPDPSFQLLETLKLEGGDYLLLDRHLSRLSASANYFGIPVEIDQVLTNLQEHARQFPSAIRRVRLLVSQTGTIHIESAELPELGEAVLSVALADAPVSKADTFLYHKTTQRHVYQSHRDGHPERFDVLLWNEDGHITECTYGNIVLELGGKKLTPSRDCGLLAGTYRAKLLDEGVIQEGYLTQSDARKATRIWFINSVRGWVRVRLAESYEGIRHATENMFLDRSQ